MIIFVNGQKNMVQFFYKKNINENNFDNFLFKIDYTRIWKCSLCS